MRKTVVFVDKQIKSFLYYRDTTFFLALSFENNKILKMLISYLSTNAGENKLNADCEFYSDN